MRIAREWDHPTVVEARESGVQIDSINKFLKVLRGQPLTSKPKDQSPSQIKRDKMRETLRNEFANKIRELDGAELSVLTDVNRGELYTLNRLWDHLYERLRTAVEVVYGEDDDPHTSTVPDRPERAKATAALNERRKTAQLSKTHPK